MDWHFYLYFFQTLLALTATLLKYVGKLIAVYFTRSYYKLCAEEKHALHQQRLGVLLYDLAVTCGTVSRKTLQTLATRTDLFPATISQELRKVCRSVEEMSTEDVASILHAAYPDTSTKRKFPFDSFDYNAIASGCIAQVHVATIKKTVLQSGRHKKFALKAASIITDNNDSEASAPNASVKVAVKIYRKNIRRFVDYDFRILLLATYVVQFCMRERIRMQQWSHYFPYFFLDWLTLGGLPDFKRSEADEQWSQYTLQYNQSRGRQTDVVRLIEKTQQDFVLQAHPANEMKNMQDFAREYTVRSPHLTWSVLYPEHCRVQCGVIVMQYMDGFTLQDHHQLSQCSEEQKRLIYSELLQFGMSTLFLRTLYPVSYTHLT